MKVIPLAAPGFAIGYKQRSRRDRTTSSKREWFPSQYRPAASELELYDGAAVRHGLDASIDEGLAVEEAAFAEASS